jgi:hypothetical protein
VLAHRISLLAVHAGALEVRRDAPPAERAAAGVIRECAHDALEDLREVIGMLREPVGDQPRPTLGEPVDLAGGRLEHWPAPAGDFQVRAWLPWPR